MLDICLLGTGGMLPLPKRWLTSMMARYNGKGVLIDCGEGTQVAMKEKGWSAKNIDVMCFTHYHADHISGLPGMLLTMGNAERTEPLLMIGPKGLARVVDSLRVIAPEIPFDIIYREIQEPEEMIDLGGFYLKAFRVNHSVTCYGYSIIVERKGRFDANKAKELQIPLPFWKRLQRGETVSDENMTYTPDMVLGPARRGLKVTYCTDSRPVDSIVSNAAEADLFICEGMYGEPEKAEKARQNKHMTFYEAAKLAKQAAVKELWLTHFSPSLVRPEPYMDEVRAIFANAKPGKDGKSVDLLFDDEEE